jgi:hypothetical protein
MITKQIDGKTVSFWLSFWLDGLFVRASIGDRVIGDVAARYTHPTEGIMWTRARDWQLFAAAVLDYLPSSTPADSVIAADIKARLFDIVISVGEQLRKEAA